MSKYYFTRFATICLHGANTRRSKKKRVFGLKNGNTYRASVLERNALQGVRFGEFVAYQTFVVSDVIACAAVLLERSARVANRLFFGVEEALVFHVGHDLNELK